MVVPAYPCSANSSAAALTMVARVCSICRLLRSRTLTLLMSLVCHSSHWSHIPIQCHRILWVFWPPLPTQGAQEMSDPVSIENHDVIVIGGGQAGLAAAYHLMQAGLDFVVLDADNRTGDEWRRRWGSLRLFTPARHDGLPGMAFPARPGSFPAKDEVADYLTEYVERFSLPVRNGVRVSQLKRV